MFAYFARGNGGSAVFVGSSQEVTDKLMTFHELCGLTLRAGVAA